MAIVNKLTTLMPAFGAPTEYVALAAQAQTTAGTTNNALTGFINFVRSGRIRFKTVPAAGTAALTAVVITATDGTTTITLYQDATARTASTNQEFLYSFISELNLTTITVALTWGAGTASTVDLEITGNP
jgi:hypothetical protein